MRLGDTAAILGAGPIGLLCMQVAKAPGIQGVFGRVEVGKAVVTTDQVAKDDVPSSETWVQLTVRAYWPDTSVVTMALANPRYWV